MRHPERVKPLFWAERELSIQDVLKDSAACALDERFFGGPEHKKTPFLLLERLRLIQGSDLSGREKTTSDPIELGHRPAPFEIDPDRSMARHGQAEPAASVA